MCQIFKTSPYRWIPLKFHPKIYKDLKIILKDLYHNSIRVHSSNSSRTWFRIKTWLDKICLHKTIKTPKTVSDLFLFLNNKWDPKIQDHHRYRIKIKSLKYKLDLQLEAPSFKEDLCPFKHRNKSHSQDFIMDPLNWDQMWRLNNNSTGQDLQCRWINQITCLRLLSNKLHKCRLWIKTKRNSQHKYRQNKKLRQFHNNRILLRILQHQWISTTLCHKQP